MRFVPCGKCRNLLEKSVFIYTEKVIVEKKMNLEIQFKFENILKYFRNEGKYGRR